MSKGLDAKFGILAPTLAKQAAGEQGDDQPESNGNGESRGPLRPTKPRRGRRPKPAGNVSGRKFQLPDSVFERLQLHAIKKRSNPSAVVADLLDRELPKHKIATDE